MTNIDTFRDQVRKNLLFLFKHFIVEVREGTNIESRMEYLTPYREQVIRLIVENDQINFLCIWLTSNVPKLNSGNSNVTVTVEIYM